MTDRLRMQDPREQYPKPPFGEQPQPVPGLARDMSPKADHGEESYRGSGKLQGRRALITGGDSGIGRAAAIAFAREGADVAINYLPTEEADAREVVALIEAEGRTAAAIPGDVTDEKFARDLPRRAAEALGGLDVLVVNAGHQQSFDTLAEVTSAEFDETMKVNVYALFWTTQAALPLMPPGSSIIVTSSVQAYDPSASLIQYATTKAAQVAYTKALASQTLKRGVRANLVAPGPFWTALQASGGQPPEAVATFGEGSAYGRPGQPVEIAPAYVLLASQEGSYMNGEVLAVTGGSGSVA